MRKGQWVKKYKSIAELAEKLKKLYWEQGLSINAIAKMEQVSPPTVHKRMKKFGMLCRGQHDWHHVNVNLEPSCELAYILGVLLGDGSAPNPGRQIRLRVTEYSFAKSFYDALRKIGFRPKITVEEQRGLGNKPLHVVTAASTDFVKWFKSLSMGDIERITLKSKDYASQFIRGFYESEGNFNCGKVGNPRAIMSNTKAERIELVAKAMRFLGFRAYIQGPYPYETGYKYYLSTARPETVSFIQEISPCIKGGI
jgi:intein-encoded DNA endonuclease-like protein